MSKLLLELFSEEIPALMQQQAEEAYKAIFIKILAKNEIFAKVQVFVGPRRVTIYISHLPEFTLPKEVKIKGPKINAPEQAIEGFCRSNNISKNQLTTMSVQNQIYYLYIKSIEAIDIRKLLKYILPQAISLYVWPKSMYWGSYTISWVRPLKNILCIFDEQVLSFKFGHLTSNNITYGHRFMTSQAIQIKDFADYKDKLIKNHVILDRQERQELIKKQLLVIANLYNLSVKEDKKLLEEVAGLVEFPTVMIGKIEAKFLNLPNEVLMASMKIHQKYFSAFDSHGNFAPYFFFVSNMLSDQNIIVNGNEKVLSARLSDALYLYQQDLAKSLESRLEKLAQIIFCTKLGNLQEKTERIMAICDYLMPQNESLKMAARFCKSDLTSEMVGEFPELQGIMGYYYAMNENLGENIAIAIKDHYKPQGPSDNVPSGNAAILALADKIDNIVGLILIEGEVNGSKDPYSLRRQALAIIRIILENKLHLDIKELVLFVVKLYQDLLSLNNEYTDRLLNNQRSHLEFTSASLNIKMPHKVQDDIQVSKIQLIQFFLQERVKYHFKNQYDISLIDAMLDFNLEGDLVITEMKLIALQQFLVSNKGQDLLMSYRRVNNILADTKPSGKINQHDFISNYEQELFTELMIMNEQINNNIVDKNFMQSLHLLPKLLIPISNFFDNIMVKCEDPQIANNRLLLLQMVKQLFHKIAQFDSL